MGAAGGGGGERKSRHAFCRSIGGGDASSCAALALGVERLNIQCIRWKDPRWIWLKMTPFILHIRTTLVPHSTFHRSKHHRGVQRGEDQDGHVHDM